MKTSKRDTIFLLVALLALTSIVCVGSVGEGGGPPEADPNPLTAILTELSGTVQVLKPADGFLSDAFDGQTIVVSDQVLTHADGRARINFSNGTMLRISPLSTFTMEALHTTDEGAYARLKLEIGKLWIILRGGSIEVDTPSGLASVRGSYLFVWVQPETNQTRITCLEGECGLGNGAGTVDLVAGQTGLITDPDTAPEKGRMSDEDVDEWLKENPEATEVIPPLTATVAALDGLVPPKETTATPTSADCGPPEDWVLYTAREKDTLETIGKAYRISVAALQQANCMGKAVEIFPGQGLFVPNVATTTPTPTNTATATKTPLPSTATNTPLPTNSPALFTPISYPTGTISACLNLYKIDVVDADGIDFVKLYYSTSAADPKDTGTYHTMTNVGGDTYKGDFYIDTWDAATDIVKFRFAVWDSAGVKHFYPDPASAPLSYNDPIDCGDASSFTPITNPPGGSTITVCGNDYKVIVTDPDIVKEVYVYHPGIGAPDFVLMPNVGGDTYEITNYSIPANTGDTVSWAFKAYDKRGDVTLLPTSGYFVFTSGLTCP